MDRLSHRKYYPTENLISRFIVGLNEKEDVFDNIKVVKLLTDNGREKSMEIEGSIPIRGIMYQNTKPTDDEIFHTSAKFHEESYEEYLKLSREIPEINYEWLKNIVNGTHEQGCVINRTDNIIILRDYTWGNHELHDVRQMHLLTVLSDQHLYSVRDLTQDHVPILEKMYDETLKIIKTKFGLDSDRVKAFFHYPPSTYLLHLHFMHVENISSKTSFEKCYDIDQVISNLKLDTNYYRNTLKVLRYCKEE